MNKLNGFYFYLSGPIDFAKDDGVTWRKDITEFLSNMNVRVFDPTNKPVKLNSKEVGEEKNYHKKLKQEGRWDELRKFAKHIRSVDLRACDKTDGCIAFMDMDVFMMGTFDEMIMAERQNKPVFTVVKQGKKNAPLWLFAVCRPEEIFDSFDELKDYLMKLDSGDIELDKRFIKL